MKNSIRIRNLSPLRYSGSKRKLVFYLYSVLKHNNLVPNVLVEPFVGGGNISLNFIVNDIVKKIIISDKDRLIYSFWHVVFYNPGYLINFIKKVKITLGTFYEYKEIVKNINNYNKNKLAEACLFLNRTSFSGILTDSAGPLGGKDQESKYKIDCRFYKERLIEKIKYISKFKSRVVVLNYDWRDTIEYAKQWAKNKKNLNRLFFYFDPPFFNKADNLYRCYFSEKEHMQFYKAIISLNYDWVLSYDNAPEIREMYSGDKYLKMNIEMPCSINSNSQKDQRELIITTLALPNANK